MGESGNRESAVAEPASLTLPTELGIEHAAALKALLLPAVTQAGELKVDGGAVARVHAAALQLIAALWRDRHDAGLATVWSGASASLRETAATLGLNDLLNLPTEPR